MGVVGLEDRGRLQINPNDKLLTQSIVSYQHYKIFGFYYPPEILNWGCDDWITEIYQQHNMVYRLNQGFYNMGGEPRYKIDIKCLVILYHAPRDHGPSANRCFAAARACGETSICFNFL